VIFLALRSPSTLSTSKKHTTGGSDVRGKASPIWVRKVSIVFAPYSIDTLGLIFNFFCYNLTTLFSFSCNLASYSSCSRLCRLTQMDGSIPCQIGCILFLLLFANLFVSLLSATWRPILFVQMMQVFLLVSVHCFIYKFLSG
jgi:hypothetical protein